MRHRRVSVFHEIPSILIYLHENTAWLLYLLFKMGVVVAAVQISFGNYPFERKLKQ